MSSAALSWPSILTELIAGRNLDEATAREVMSTILHGDATAAQIAGFLVALRAKGEHVDELTGLLGGALDEATLVPLTDDERADASTSSAPAATDRTRSTCRRWPHS
jgi:anthranilate phosphoribosyltransferase